MARVRIALPLLTLTAVSTCSFFLFTFARAQTICQVGEHPATAAEVPLMIQAGISNAQIGMCWNPIDKNVGQNSAQAKQDLSTMWCGGRPATCGSYTSTIEGLDSNFAVCADKFMKALRSQNPSACIRSAYRSTEHQICACGGNAAGVPGKCAPAGRSYHQKGLAIDVNHGGTSNQQFWNTAAQAGLGNPPGLNVSDPDHIQPIGGTATCSGSPVPQNDSGDVYMGGVSPATQSPLSSLMSGIRSMLGMSQPTPPYQQPQYVPPMQTFPTSSSQTYYDSNGQPINPNQPTLNTTNPNGGAGQTTTIGDTGIYATSSSSGNSNANSDINYINDLANTLADQTGNTSTNASGSAQLNQNLQNVGGVGGPNTTNGQPNGAYQYPIVLPPEVTQTFGSPNTTGDLTYSPVPSSPFQQFLGRLKGVLQVIASLLSPFGGRTQTVQYME